jgi:hypothetical protein
VKVIRWELLTPIGRSKLWNMSWRIPKLALNNTDTEGVEDVNDRGMSHSETSNRTEEHISQLE